MLDNIKAHSLKVEQVARIIAQGLIKSGINISIEKVTAGALMHDIAKTMCLGSPEDHATMGMEICIDNSFTEIAEIVGEHIQLKSYNPDSEVNEKEIIYYSDKRVNHDEVVSLEKRLEYLLDRYAKNEKALVPRIEANFRKCREVEKKIFSYLDFSPEDLEELAR
jgi:putative nucleotidyltransferase with HDIG domain